MGLAASQARLLLLTSRKDDVESQLMFIANQKLALARQSAKLSSEYSDALSATKLKITDVNGNSVNMTYGLLMSPNATSESQQYMLADNYGRAMLSDSYANVFDPSGSASSGGVGSVTASDFLQKEMGIGASQASSFVSGYTAKGYNDSDVWNYLAANCSYGSIDGSYDGGATGKVTNSYSSNPSAAQVVCLANVNTTASDPNTTLPVILQDVTGDVEAALKNQLGSKFSSDAASTAYSMTLAHYESSLNDHEREWNTIGSAQDTASGHNEITENLDHGDRWWIDTSQIIKTFLNYYDGANASNDGNYAAQQNYYAYNGTLSGSGHGSACTSSATRVDPGSNQSGQTEANFYINMYNYIAKNGWTRVSGIDSDNGATMQNLLNNGEAHLCEATTSGTWDVVSTSSYDSLVSQETDDSTITAAEAKYDSEKALLDVKEQKLDIQKNNLDTERSAIDTELDSVQKVIDKNIERSFKIFQNA